MLLFLLALHMHTNIYSSSSFGHLWYARILIRQRIEIVSFCRNPSPLLSFSFSLSQFVALLRLSSFASCFFLLLLLLLLAQLLLFLHPFASIFYLLSVFGFCLLHSVYVASIVRPIWCFAHQKFDFEHRWHYILLRLLFFYGFCVLFLSSSPYAALTPLSVAFRFSLPLIFLRSFFVYIKFLCMFSIISTFLAIFSLSKCMVLFGSHQSIFCNRHHLLLVFCVLFDEMFDSCFSFRCFS